MNCLQCGKPAIEKGEEYKGIKIRECENWHRTAIDITASRRVKLNKHGTYKIPKAA